MRRDGLVAAATRVRWTPSAPPPRWFQDAVCALVVAMGGLRGLDLATAPQTGGALLEVANIIGQHWWGWAQVATAVCVLIAVMLRSLVGIIAGHVLAGAVWLGFSVALLQGLLESPGTSGWRFVLTAAGVAIAHGLLVVACVQQLGNELRGVHADARS